MEKFWGWYKRNISGGGPSSDFQTNLQGNGGQSEPANFDLQTPDIPPDGTTAGEIVGGLMQDVATGTVVGVLEHVIDKSMEPKVEGK